MPTNTIVTTKLPYELLIRWGADGKVQGAHVQWRYVTNDFGTVTESVSPAESLHLTGFPLKDILSQTEVNALSELGKIQSELAAEKSARFLEKQDSDAKLHQANVELLDAQTKLNSKKP